MSTSAWTGRQLQARSIQTQHLKAQAKAHQMKLQRAQEKIQSLSNQLPEALQAEGDIDPLTEPEESSSDRHRKSPLLSQ
jgi:predicted  nucleic acid-binding Zn-ribbon protein